jgi:putative thioredoxin
VIVDFWATWCGPCRQLAPILERIVEQHQGKVVLAKVNIDQAQDLAAAFAVQSIPYVVAIREGAPVSHFRGLLPEEQLQKWVEALLPSPAEQLVREGAGLEAGDPAAAEQRFRQAVSLEPQNDAAKVHLARVLLTQDREDESRQLISELEKQGFLSPEAEKIKSALDLRQAAHEAGSVDDARKAAQAAPDNLKLQLRLADSLAADGRPEEALDICLDLIRRDKTGVGATAKQTMLKIFDVLGAESDLVGAYRRKLTSLLY